MIVIFILSCLSAAFFSGYYLCEINSMKRRRKMHDVQKVSQADVQRDYINLLNYTGDVQNDFYAIPQAERITNDKQ